MNNNNHLLAVSTNNNSDILQFYDLFENLWILSELREQPAKIYE